MHNNVEEIDQSNPPEFLDTGTDTGDVIVRVPKGAMMLCISPTKDREGYGLNLIQNYDSTLPITLAQSIYALSVGCMEAIKYKKESLFKLAIIFERKRKAQEIDPETVIWNKETPEHYLNNSGVKGSA